MLFSFPPSIVIPSAAHWHPGHILHPDDGDQSESPAHTVSQSHGHSDCKCVTHIARSDHLTQPYCESIFACEWVSECEWVCVHLHRCVFLTQMWCYKGLLVCLSLNDVSTGMSCSIITVCLRVVKRFLVTPCVCVCLSIYVGQTPMYVRTPAQNLLECNVYWMYDFK